MSVKISVIMPAYNSESYIKKSIESILSQTYKHLELIIIDDGSTDGTRSVVSTIADERLRYIYQRNKGVRRLAETLNHGLLHASGELVTMFPSDDLCLPERFEKQVEQFQDPEVVLSFGKMRLIDEADRPIGSFKQRKDIRKMLSGPVEQLRKAYLLSNFIPQPTVLLRRSVLEEIGGYQQRDFMYAEDYPTQMLFVAKGKWTYVNEYLAEYRIHGNQMTKKHVLPMYRSDALFRLQELRAIAPKGPARQSIEKKALQRAIIQQMYHGYFAEGLRCWKKGNVSPAQRHFLRAVYKGHVRTKAKAILCSIAVVAGIQATTAERMVENYRKIMRA